MKNQEEPVSRARRAFMRFYVDSQQVQIHVPLERQVFLYDRRPWIEIEWPPKPQGQWWDAAVARCKAEALSIHPDMQAVERVRNGEKQG